MSFAGKVWRLLVGIKDGLVLVFMLLFFMALFAVLSARPSPGQVRDGALLLDLNGFIVEERAEIDPFATLISGEAPVSEFEARELVRAIDAAASDERIKAVVLDLRMFLGGGQVHLQEVGEALNRVKAADKPVFSYGLAYSDPALLLASHADEVWMDPLGVAYIAGPGGSAMFYKDMLDKLSVNAKTYRVGTYKAGIEPFERNSFSDEARRNIQAVIDTRWEEWQAHVKATRPAANIELVATDPETYIQSGNGDIAQAGVDAGLIDKLGSFEEFAVRVAEVAGEGSTDNPGDFAQNSLKVWLAANPADTDGKKIAVVNVAGAIVDGDAGPGTAGGDRIADLLNNGLDDDYDGLVVRVDSGGGSVLASEQIRRAIERYREKDIPVAVSFANVAASGGYWVATAGDRIFAQPETVTGSIGVYGFLPTFENSLAEIGVSTDRLATTPLSGQPDTLGGFTPEVDTLIQTSIDRVYTQFLAIVSEARNMPVEKVDEIAQGQVWDGGTARQNGLIDQFGGLQEAAAWVAEQAEAGEEGFHLVTLGGSVDPYQSLIRQLMSSDARAPVMSGDFAGHVAVGQRAAMGRIASDLERMLRGTGIQAYCEFCPVQPRAADLSKGDQLITKASNVLAK
ncbi:signal peptide peptidase SppA [Altererythrobacter lutimaris]|uniref:Signal peptide peptidase SppA n=1 Tax=Altererythrobacter lutimaris TaxID=2743979 RepID=A0A850HHU4_9SPHN|nr:signal peptide peptidase SppA [Altererythrobacter lutimaris]NVE94832.1 signal peptide peptidase SppA [Altererythrobacter lutimaris]